MAETKEKRIDILKIIIEECLRKLKILGWCVTNNNAFDCTGTYNIAKLLRRRKNGLQSILAEIYEIPDQLSLSRFLNSKDSSIFRDESTSGEERIYYDRFEYLDKCKVIKYLSKRVKILKYKHHSLNQKLHEESQIEMTKQRFIKSWESARKEQLQQSIKSHIDILKHEETLMNRNKAKGIQAAMAIEKYYEWQLTRTEQDIENWMTRFESEKEEQDSRFQKARATEKYWNELKQIYDQQEREILVLEAELKRWEEEAKFKEFCHRMAIKLQAWWRGVMVRKGYGRFGDSGRNRDKKIKGKDKKNKKTKH